MVVKSVIIKNLIAKIILFLTMNRRKVNWYRFACRRFPFIGHIFISTTVTAEFTSIPRIVTALSSYFYHHKHHQPIKITTIKNEVSNIPNTDSPFDNFRGSNPNRRSKLIVGLI